MEKRGKLKPYKLFLKEKVIAFSGKRIQSIRAAYKPSTVRVQAPKLLYIHRISEILSWKWAFHKVNLPANSHSLFGHLRCITTYTGFSFLHLSKAHCIWEIRGPRSEGSPTIQYKNSLCKEILWQASCAVLLNLVLTSFESAPGTPKPVLKAHTIAWEEISQCDERERMKKNWNVS